MDDLEIYLPCAFKTVFKNVINQPEEFNCMVCKDHLIDRNECLRMKRNLLKIREKQIELENIKFNLLKEELILNEKMDVVVHDNFESIIQEIDLKREKLKQKIDDYCLELIDKLKKEKDSNQEFYRTIIERNSIFEFEGVCKRNESFANKIEYLEEKLKELGTKINELETIRSTKDNLYKLVSSSDNIEEIIGQIVNVPQESCIKNEYEFKAEKFSSRHVKWINDVKLFNQELVLSASADRSIKLWNKSSGKIEREFYGHFDSVLCLCVLDYELFASGSCDKKIKIWSVESEKSINTLDSHTNWVNCLRKLKSGELASGSMDHTIKIWSLIRCIKTLIGHESSVNCLEETSDGILISGSSDNTIKLWDTEKETILKSLKGDLMWVMSLKLLDKAILACGTFDKKIVLWNIENEKCIKTVIGHSNAVISLDKLDNNHLVSGSKGSAIRIWDYDLSNCVKIIESKKDILCCLCVSKNNEIITGLWEGRIKIWKK